VLLGVNVLIALSVVTFAGTDLSLMGTVARIGLLLIFTAASIRMGAVLRRTDELLEERRVDAGSGMLNEYGLVDYGGSLWSDCRRSNVPATLVFLDAPDLPGLRGLYGSRIARLAVEKTLRLMESLATGRNLVGRLGPSRFALLMPGSTRDQALEFLGSRLGHPPQIELDEDDLELIFLLNLHVAESQNQGVTFSRFFEAERGMLDFYFSDPHGSVDIAEPEPPVSDAAASTGATAVARRLSAMPVLSPRPADLTPPPSTLPMEPG
jgi:GGDEF domain-containing protein